MQLHLHNAQKMVHMHRPAGAEESSGDPGRLRGKWAQRPRRRHTIGLDRGLYRVLLVPVARGRYWLVK